MVLQGKGVMFNKRVNLFMGHYGSGKTTVAVNYAISLARLKNKVSIYDLDIVNPYYRTVDALGMLEAEGVDLIVSPFAETNVDIPAMNSASYKMIDDLSRFAVVDIGGDDRGALALGRFSEKIKEENNFEAYMVVNKFRPETKDISGVLSVMEEIERAGKIKFTALVNNSNLGKETTINEILEGEDFCKEVEKNTGIPLKITSIRKDLIDKKYQIKNVLPVEEIKYGSWI